MCLFVIRWIRDTCFSKGFLTLYASATLTTMLIATTITRPSFAVIDAQSLTSSSNLTLRHITIR